MFGLDPTANYHKPLAEFLIERCHCVVLVSGVAVKRNRELLDGRWDKHDMKDAANVADLISQGKCLFYECPSEELNCTCFSKKNDNGHGYFLTVVVVYSIQKMLFFISTLYPPNPIFSPYGGTHGHIQKSYRIIP